MFQFAQTAEAIGATSKKLEKTALVAAYFQTLSRSGDLSEAASAATFFSGRPFPAYEEMTLQVGGSLLWRVIGDLSGKSEAELTEIYRRHGDAGSVAAEALAATAKSHSGLSLTEVQQAFFEIASARGPSLKAARLGRLVERAAPLEAKYIVKIISGDLRVGLKESLVEEAIARAFEVPLDQVKRANMLLGDVGATLRLAASGTLHDAQLRVFHPLDFMLASPVESSAEALSYFQNASVEDKYDGIRAQTHISHGQVRIFSRTRDEITSSFPELAPALAGLRGDAILDGEIVAWKSGLKSEAGETAGRALPFSTLQQRLGRKKVSAQLMRDVPVAYLVFDILYSGGSLLLDHPLSGRGELLNEILTTAEAHAAIDAVVRRGAGEEAAVATPSQSTFSFAAPDIPVATVLRAPVATAHSPEDLETLFAAARERGNEGLIIKDLKSPYTPGRRGKSWLKMKRELATLDVVVTAVEYGHGKRIGVLSDYTFAVWKEERLVNIGKAYSGLTDAEIAEMTGWFLAHKVSEQGQRLVVEPKIVLEVAFNNMMRSTRHESGYALRFPRIVRLRPDKRPEDADNIDAVKEIYERQALTSG
jgi:DNA ligase 1